MKSDIKYAVEALEEKEQIEVLTAGCSMRPLFREHKDVVVIKRVTRPLKKGDVVLYPTKLGRKNILHRIMRFKGDTVIIRGDNNYKTEYIPRERIKGILVEFYRNEKHVVCEKSFKYKLYTFYICHSYWLRFPIKKAHYFLSAIKRKIFKKKTAKM